MFLATFTAGLVIALRWNPNWHIWDKHDFVLTMLGVLVAAPAGLALATYITVLAGEWVRRR